MRALRRLKADRVTLIAAGMAFYWFLAVFPALLATVGIFGFTSLQPDAVDSINHAIETALPADAAEVLTDTLNQTVGQHRGHSVLAILVGLLVALWSASAGMAALQEGLSVVYHVPTRAYLRRRGRALLLVLAAIVLGGIATALIVFGHPLGKAIDDHLPFGGAVFTPVWTVVRYVVGMAALELLFAVVYYFGPNRETQPRWSWISPGGLVGAGIWLIASVGFSFYVTSLGSYGRSYGSLTGVVVLMLWFYLTALAILAGGEINADLEARSA